MKVYPNMKNIQVSIGVGLAIALLTSACKINGSFQGLYGYQDKTMKNRPGFIVKPDTSICALSVLDSSVYAINGKELSKCLSTINLSLVYFWQPKCHSEACISPVVLQERCREAGLELFVIAEYYDHYLMDVFNVMDRPIFGINEDFYGTSLTSLYLERFWFDVAGTDATMERQRFVLFKKGRPVAAASQVDEVLVRVGTF